MRADTRRRALPKLIELCVVTSSSCLSDGQQYSSREGGGGVELLNKDFYRAGTLYGEATTRGQSPYPFIYHFCQK